MGGPDSTYGSPITRKLSCFVSVLYHRLEYKAAE